jgi:hypothetical protein
MKETKFIVRVAMSVALLIAVQMALTAINGVELVTVILLSISFCYGVRTGLTVATAFSLLRCLYFGFYINIIVLYLIYYNLFALFFGWLGKRFSGDITWTRQAFIVAAAVVFTILFTLLDNTITVLMFGFRGNAAKVYFLQSLTAVVPQTICTVVSVSLLFVPLTKVIRRINF